MDDDDLPFVIEDEELVRQIETLAQRLAITPEETVKFCVWSELNEAGIPSTLVERLAAFRVVYPAADV
jgi:hypothetical protein